MLVQYYLTAAGNNPVRKWLQDLDNDAKLEVGATVWELEANGLAALDIKQVKGHSHGRLWEIRTASHRLFYVLIYGPTAVLLHGYKKQSQKAPRKEIETAVRRARDVLGS